jgi:hypothetical protein
MKLIANKEMYYAGRMLKAEEEFECEEKFVDVLILVSSARKPKQEKRGYKRRDMVVESP